MYYFRLVIPRCNRDEKIGNFYCELSNIDNINNLQNSLRYNLLQAAFNSVFLQMAIYLGFTIPIAIIE